MAYPIIKLPPEQRDVHQYLRTLESLVIDVLALWKIPGSRKDGWTGVWVGEAEIASIGWAVRRWVTYHGLALNISNDLQLFETIQPVDCKPKPMTRLVDWAPEATVEAVQPN